MSKVDWIPYQARLYIKMAADQGDSENQMTYARMLYKGEGGPQDREQAREYYKKAADQGNSEAQIAYNVLS